MPSTKPAKVGRPSMLSHEHILCVALELLRESGEQGLTMRKLAGQLSVTPPTLYGYFTSKQALLEALANHYYPTLSDAVDFDAPWQEVVKNWLNQLHRQFKNRPELMWLTGMMATSPQGLLELEKLARVLLQVFPDERSAVAQAQSLLWTVLSFSHFEFAATAPDVVQRLKTAMNDETGSMVARHLAVEDYNDMWEQTVIRNIEGLVALAR